jgi:hypothetical protein
MTTPFHPIKLLGCDLIGYAWGTPPDFRPHPSYEAGLRIIRAAFAALPGAPR